MAEFRAPTSSLGFGLVGGPASSAVGKMGDGLASMESANASAPLAHPLEAVLRAQATLTLPKAFRFEVDIMRREDHGPASSRLGLETLLGTLGTVEPEDYLNMPEFRTSPDGLGFK